MSDDSTDLADLRATRDALFRHVVDLESRPMVTTLLLCDRAHVVNGLLTIFGGGWNLIAPGVPSAIAVKITTPAQLADTPQVLTLALRDEDGRTVRGNDGAPVAVAVPFIVQATPETPPGAPLSSALTVSVPGLPLRPGARYVWHASVNAGPTVTAAFAVRPS